MTQFVCSACKKQVNDSLNSDGRCSICSLGSLVDGMHQERLAKMSPAQLASHYADKGKEERNKSLSMAIALGGFLLGYYFWWSWSDNHFFFKIFTSLAGGLIGTVVAAFAASAMVGEKK